MSNFNYLNSLLISVSKLSLARNFEYFQLSSSCLWGRRLSQWRVSRRGEESPISYCEGNNGGRSLPAKTTSPVDGRSLLLGETIFARRRPKMATDVQNSRKKTFSFQRETSANQTKHCAQKIRNETKTDKIKNHSIYC